MVIRSIYQLELDGYEGISRHHVLTLPEPTIRILLLSGFNRIAVSLDLNENSFSDSIFSLLFSNFSIFAGLICVPIDKDRSDFLKGHSYKMAPF